MINGILDFIKLKWHFNFYSPKKLKKYQLKQIKKLITYSKRHSLFYKRKYKNKNVRTWGNFYELPLIRYEINDLKKRLQKELKQYNIEKYELKILAKKIFT